MLSANKYDMFNLLTREGELHKTLCVPEFIFCLNMDSRCPVIN